MAHTAVTARSADQTARLYAAGACIAASLLGLATLAPAWARLDVETTGQTRSPRGGDAMSALLLGLAVGAGLAAVVYAWRLSRAAARVQIATGAMALAVTVVLALDSIASANRLAARYPGPTVTAYGLGGPLALASSLTILVLGFIESAGLSR